jgi:hypothetical protein
MIIELTGWGENNMEVIYIAFAAHFSLRKRSREPINNNMSNNDE